MTIHCGLYQPETGRDIIWILELDVPDVEDGLSRTVGVSGNLTQPRSELFVAPSSLRPILPPFPAHCIPSAVSTPDQEAVKLSESIDYAAPPSRQARSTDNGTHKLHPLPEYSNERATGRRRFVLRNDSAITVKDFVTQHQGSCLSEVSYRDRNEYESSDSG
ncbi:uncharacterized protein ARMOST_16825 [Armillaria ostoyae]|uniref:Uncharacterized protein n=1 Tax=Armillaria ostoyae TaxID=47428 RepID=A0A284RXA2_ARMOS|nr:uncharacterized protein ARMOST_16825 [Armillaria ostoyae]